jgi:hypothetical protein
MLSHYLNRALEHATLAGEQYNDGEVSEHVFTDRYGRPLTYDGLRAAMRIAGNEISYTGEMSSVLLPLLPVSGASTRTGRKVEGSSTNCRINTY